MLKAMLTVRRRSPTRSMVKQVMEVDDNVADEQTAAEEQGDALRHAEVGWEERRRMGADR